MGKRGLLNFRVRCFHRAKSPAAAAKKGLSIRAQITSLCARIKSRRMAPSGNIWVLKFNDYWFSRALHGIQFGNALRLGEREVLFWNIAHAEHAFQRQRSICIASCGCCWRSEVSGARIYVIWMNAGGLLKLRRCWRQFEEVAINGKG